MIYAIGMSFINIKILKEKSFGYFNIGLNIFLLLLFLAVGLSTLTALHHTTLTDQVTNHFQQTGWNTIVLYIGLIISFGLLYTLYLITVEEFIQPFFFNIKIGFDILLHFFLIVIASNQMLYWISHASNDSANTIGLSILWGLYSLLLIIAGIRKNQQHLRIMAIILFGITLFKLIFYDTAHLETVPKTIVFVSLGLMLLLISFLYNKFKDSLKEENP
jgi:hypothetical protein